MTSAEYPVWGLISPANLLTISRIVFTPVLVWLVLAASDTGGASWAAFVLGFGLAVTDFFDGKLARRDNNISRSGAFLDPLADKLVVLGAGYAFVAVGRLSWIPITIIAVRELAVSGLRVYYSTKGLAVPARPLAKWKTTIQGAALLLAALPPLWDSRAGDVIVNLALWVAVAFTVVTGVQYFVDGSAATRTTGSYD